MDVDLAASTPLERRGGLWLKREDTFSVFGQPGAKARACAAILLAALHEVRDVPYTTAVTACGRKSPQAHIVAAVAAGLGLHSEVHTPSGNAGPELVAALELGARRVAHRPGHNSVIIARAREAAEQPGHVHVPFGMACEAAVEQTALQVPDVLPAAVRRIVVPVGSGINLAGVLRGMARHGHTVPVLGVVVGADPRPRLNRYAPGWDGTAQLGGPTLPPVYLEQAHDPYQHTVDAEIDGVVLDPIYEAKCAAYLQPDDLFWIVGIRAAL